MSIKPGTRIGPYEVTSPLGEGGMGVVFRAHDTKLQRDVALKLLPDHFADDPERLVRFQREAQILASLNHPSIAQIHGLEESDSARCIVMEMVEGATLQELLKRGPIPIDEVLPIAKQIAEALEAAHERAIIHRDLKPANIKLTSDGKIKVLDFGLAKAFQEQQAAALSNSPTLIGASVPGVILGTAAYMSPEQAKGKETDRTTDVWAFGCVLYEMVTGHAVFDGETVGEILGGVFKAEPDWHRLPTETPEGIRRLLRRCLRKERKHRLQYIGDARIEIEELQIGAAVADDPSEAPSRRRSKVWAGIAAAFLVTTLASLAALSLVYFNRSRPPEIRLEVNTPATGDPLSFAISPDGRQLVFSALNEGKSQLWVRPLDSLTARPLAGTDGGIYPFWSPDSAFVGFFADGQLKRIDIVGGVPRFLANVNNGRGGSWNRGDIILFGQGGGVLRKVPARGGESTAITPEDLRQSHRFPQFLPDGGHFIYFVQLGPERGVYIGSLDGSPSKRLAAADAAAVVSPSGFLLLTRQNILFAQAFDFKNLELTGDPFPVAEQVPFDTATNAPGFSAASDIVVYRTGSVGRARQLTWLDRSGAKVGTVGVPERADLGDPALSPDGKRVAVNLTLNGDQDVWLFDVARGLRTRFTDDAALDLRALWSQPDGSRIVFSSSRTGILSLYWRSSSGTGETEPLLETDRGYNIAGTADDWSHDGRFLLYRVNDPKNSWDLWVLPMFGDRKPFPLLNRPFQERDGQFSPDDKWVAYQTTESNRYEIYVTSFPVPRQKFPISTNGGVQPRWNKNGKEIFYLSLDGKLMAVPVKGSPDGQLMDIGTPVALFPVRIGLGPRLDFGRQQYAVSNDGQRFLVNLDVDEGTSSPITLIVNWKHKP